jgi:hypothetical protein
MGTLWRTTRHPAHQSRQRKRGNERHPTRKATRLAMTNDIIHADKPVIASILIATGRSGYIAGAPA